jgi:hypothetical protein
VEGGEGPGIYAPPYREPEPKGYVEPNPEFFERLANIVRNIRTKLEKADFMQLEYADKLYAFEELVEKAKQIADKEVNRERMTVEDYRWMQSMIKRFDHSLLLNLAETWAEIKQEYLQMAVIADVHTDITDSLVLMVATGLPMRIYVVVKDASGGTRITEGYIYSWHEFESGKRVKPSEWKKSVYSPEDYRTTYQYQPPWYKQFIME